MKSICEKYKADVVIFSGEMNDDNADRFIKTIRALRQKKCWDNVIVVLSTYGGSAGSAYRMARYLKSNYKKIILFLLGHCKSAGTLFALAADEIYMSDFAELGPLDVQLPKDDSLAYRTSGASYNESLQTISEYAFCFFEKYFMALITKSGGNITTKTASEIAIKISIGIMSPIAAQLDPLKIGEVSRDMSIAKKYGKKLSKDGDRAINKLVLGYPCHSYVIDYDEAVELFTDKVVNKYPCEEPEKLLFEGIEDIVRIPSMPPAQPIIRCLNDICLKKTEQDIDSTSCPKSQPPDTTAADKISDQKANAGKNQGNKTTPGNEKEEGENENDSGKDAQGKTGAS